jgi:DNA-binding beta-propeller fold protein YncE
MLRIAFALFACLALFPPAAAAWDRGSVQRFASLPPGAPNPEGIAADRHGDIYVSGFGPTSPTGPGKVFVFGRNGHLKRVLNVANSTNALLGLGFTASDELLVVDFGASQVLRVDPDSGASTVFMTVPPGTHGLNALTFDRAGNVYVSDSFEGTIWATGPAGGLASVWKSDPLLTTGGFPPFGANGLQFNSDESALFVANTGSDTVVRIASLAGVAGAASVFTHGINGADGLILDEDDNVWVCANQSDEIVVTDASGKAIAKLGDFDGVRHGSPVGLLFPASLARSGDWIYITNLSLDLRPITGQQSVDSQWAAEVTRHTIARIRARIPRR